MNDGFNEAQWLSVCDAILAGKSLVDATRTVLTRSAEPFLSKQQRFQERAAKRFFQPERRLWTNQLLEQASDEHSAELSASYFPEGATIYDLCCGAGADSTSLARRGNLVAVDRSPVAAAITKVNLAWNGCRGTVRCENVDAIDIPPDACVHIDPDRRSSGARTTSVEWFEPGVEFL